MHAVQREKPLPKRKKAPKVQEMQLQKTAFEEESQEESGSLNKKINGH